MEYMPSPSGQAIGFIYSAGLGFALGLVYDFFRIFFYLLTGSDKKLSTVRDIIYMLFCLIVNFLFLLVMCSGRLMLYVFTGEAIGLIVYARTLSPIVYRPLRRFFLIIRKKLLLIFTLFEKIKHNVQRILQNIQENAKKQEKISEKT